MRCTALRLFTCVSPAVAGRHGKVLQTELRFREKALGKTTRELDEYQQALLDEAELQEKVAAFRPRVLQDTSVTWPLRVCAAGESVQGSCNLAVEPGICHEFG